MKRWKIVTTKYPQRYKYKDGSIEFKPHFEFNIYKRWAIFWCHFARCDSMEEAKKLIEYEENERRNKVANKYV